MKGIVFTEFLEMVEKNFGIEMTDFIITNSNLPSKGVYTSVGTYDFAEMTSLVVNLSKKTGLDKNLLIYNYGLYFFDNLVKKHKNIFIYYKTAFDLISNIESHIHVQVRKIYPNAELPVFLTHEHTNRKLVLEYQSERAMHLFAKGLIERVLIYYKENNDIVLDIKLLNDKGTKVLFTLLKNA